MTVRVPYKKICPQCGKEYETSKRNKKYCSQKCFDKARKDKAQKLIKTRICKYCGKEFTRYVSTNDEKKGGGKYCSRECSWKAKKTVKPRPCAYCGKLFTPLKNSKKLCSIECANKAKTGKSRVCPICYKEFRPRKQSSTYCCRKCADIARRNTRQNQICPTCGKIIIPGDRRRIYCSRRCRGISERAKIKRICQTCGKHFYVNPHIVKIGKGIYCSEECKRKSNGETFIEKKVREELDSYGITYEQEKGIGKHFHLDFYLLEQNIAIECDGTYWHSLPKVIRKDKRKRKYVKSIGIKLVQLPEAQIIADDFEGKFLEYVFGTTLYFFFFNSASKNNLNKK